MVTEKMCCLHRTSELQRILPVKKNKTTGYEQKSMVTVEIDALYRVLQPHLISYTIYLDE